MTASYALPITTKGTPYISITRTYSLTDFRLPADEREHNGRGSEQSERRAAHTGNITQSERDWAYAKRHLTNGESPDALIQAIAYFRQDKPDPEYYSRQTVTRAYASVALGRGDDPETVRLRVAELSPHQNNPEIRPALTDNSISKHSWRYRCTGSGRRACY
jgi:hypothetical protein